MMVSPSPSRSRSTFEVPIQAKPSRCGAYVAEFAVVALLFFVLVLAIIEFGRALMVMHLLNNAARAGARYGALEGVTTQNIKDNVNAALTNVGISGDNVTVQVNDGSADASTASQGGEITVQVTVPVSSVTWIPNLGFLSGNLGTQYTLQRE
jgi:Flp pilus assembly protein TadG